MKSTTIKLFFMPLVILILVASLLTNSTHASFGSEVRQIVASDGGVGAPFGNSVDLSGSIAVIGKVGDDSLGEGSGAAYLFDLNTGVELHKLTAADADAGDSFGTAVAISGSTVVVGADFNDDAGNASGSAYIFNAATGQQQFKLTSSDARGGDHFGRTVDVSGNLAIIGAHGHGANDDEYLNGAAYLFNVTTGQQLFKLAPSDVNNQDWFGWSVAIHGNVAIVGARYDDEAATDAGAAYLFDVTTGQQLFKLTAEDGAVGDDFGWSVAFHGNRAIVGAHLDDDNGDYSGSAYVFDVLTGQQLFKLTADDGATEDEFGRSVAISDQIVMVGASHDDTFVSAAGSAYLFDLSTGQLLSKLTADNATKSSFFGYTVAIDERTALVGAPSHQLQGTVYQFAIPEPATVVLLAVLTVAASINRRY